jgi:hypothetical protein
MQSSVCVGVVLFAALAAGPVLAQERVELYAVVLDGTTNEPVATLAPEDILIQEDGQNARVVSVEPTSWPVKLQMLVDNGQGLGSSNIQLLKDGIVNLIEALPGDVEVTLVSTSPQPRFLARGTRDRAELMEGVSRLGPDGGAGRFTESLAEATQRFEDDEGDYFPVIVSVATSIGDGNVRERDVNRIFSRLTEMPIQVHVVMLGGTGNSLSGGANTTGLGIAVTDGTGGRYENIAIANRLPDLLAELGALIAASHRLSAQQYLLTIERPEGKSGDLGQMGAGATGGRIVRSLSRDGRIR